MTIDALKKLHPAHWISRLKGLSGTPIRETEIPDARPAKSSDTRTHVPEDDMQAAKALLKKYHEELIDLRNQASDLRIQNARMGIALACEKSESKTLLEKLSSSRKSAIAQTVETDTLKAQVSRLMRELDASKTRNDRQAKDVSRLKTSLATQMAESAGRLAEVKELMYELAIHDENNPLLQPTGRYFVKTANPELNLRKFYDIAFDEKLGSPEFPSPGIFRAEVVEREMDDWHIYDDL